MKRLLVERIGGAKAFLNTSELHHLTRVLRAREGVRFEGIDPQGNRHLCELRRDSDGWYGEILTSLAEAGESPLKITLAQALIKKDKFEWVIQKAVELGVTEIIPVVSERTEVRLNEEREEKKLKRWRRILEAAVKQSGRTLIPRIRSPLSLDEMLAQKTCSFGIVMDEQGGSSLKGALANREDLDSCLVLVGPEGGWSDRDRALFSSHSLLSVSLGSRILRTETAAVVALSLLQYELGDLQPTGDSDQ